MIRVVEHAKNMQKYAEICKICRSLYIAQLAFVLVCTSVMGLPARGGRAGTASSAAEPPAERP